MIDFLETPLVPSGTQAVHTKEKFETNNTIAIGSAAAFTLEINRPEELRSKFLEAPALYGKNLQSGGEVRTIWPTGTYSPAAVLITAIRPEIANNSPIDLVDGRVPVKFIYDLPEDVQLEYFSQILASYHAINSEFGEYSQRKYTVLFTENASSIVSNEHHRVGRTIAEPHVQVWVVEDNSKQLETLKTPRLLKHERSILKLAFPHLEEEMVSLRTDLTQNVKEDVGISIRQAPPYGYILDTSIYKDEALRHQAQILTRLMKAHHQRYSEASERLTAELKNSTHQYLAGKILPQPSYKVYGAYNQAGRLEISIAPTIISGAGVVESLDRQIYRDPQNLPFFESLLKEEWYYKVISEKIHHALS